MGLRGTGEKEDREKLQIKDEKKKTWGQAWLCGKNCASQLHGWFRVQSHLKLLVISYSHKPTNFESIW